MISCDRLFRTCLGLIFLSFLLSSFSFAQSFIPPGAVAWTEPAFPTQEDDITVYFNAKEGNGGLAGSTGNVYAHTGVLTNFSTSESDWKHVKTDWPGDDPEILMTRIGEDLFSLSYNIRAFYGFTAPEEVQQLAFVFRSVGGEPTGRATDGGDIFLPVYPDTDSILMNVSGEFFGSTVDEGDSLSLFVQTNQAVTLRIIDNGDTLLTENGEVVSFTYSASSAGLHKITVLATTETDTTEQEFPYFVSDGTVSGMDPPPGNELGVNYLESTYLFMLYAPGKDNVFLLCPDNGFNLSEEFAMNETANGDTFWIELERSLFDGGDNTYQYLVDGNLRIADPYAPFVLDPEHDPFVPTSHLTGIPSSLLVQRGGSVGLI